MQAFVTNGQQSGSVQTVPRPVPGPGEVLIKIHSAALNPTDWKGAKRAPSGRIIGCDFSGTIVDPNESTWVPGQRVAGFVHGNSNNGSAANPTRGAFAEYIAIEKSLIYAVPDNLSFQQAATVPLASATAAQALYDRLRLPRPYQSKTREPLLVYGGATSVGKYAIQLGRLSGLSVIAVASLKHSGFLKSLGADEVVDYHDKDWPEQVRILTQNRLQKGLDCISEEQTIPGVARALSHTDGDHVVTLLPLSSDLKRAIQSANPQVKVESTLAYTVFGRTLKNTGYDAFDNCGEPTPKDQESWEQFLNLLPEMLQKSDFLPNHIKEIGGIEAIKDGFDLSETGQVSAEKIVFSIS